MGGLLHDLGILSIREGDRHVEDRRAADAENAYLKAYEFLHASLRHDPRNGDSHSWLADLMRRRGDYQTAVYHLKEALRLGLDNEKTRNNLAFALIRTGKLDEAARHAQKPQLLDLLAEAYARVGRFGPALEVVNRALEAARAAGESELTGRIEAKRELYRKGLVPRRR